MFKFKNYLFQVLLHLAYCTTNGWVLPITTLPAFSSGEGFYSFPFMCLIAGISVSVLEFSTFVIIYKDGITDAVSTADSI